MKKHWHLQEWFWSWKLFGFGIVHWRDSRGWGMDELEVQVGFVRLCYLSSTQMDDA